jgi:hypothetical protein
MRDDTMWGDGVDGGGGGGGGVGGGKGWEIGECRRGVNLRCIE